jgi:hypothetical protein
MVGAPAGTRSRALKPDVIVETGTDKGLGSCVFAAAILRNGSGRLTTIDTNPESGYLIGRPYADVVERIIADSVGYLRSSTARVDLFLHDWVHTLAHESAELDAVCFSERCIALSDDASGNDALLAFATRTGRRFSFFREEPEEDYPFPGEGIGAAW